MRRLLIISFFFPPRPGVGGLRLAGLAKYLPRFNWEATVVTPAYPTRNVSRGEIVETGYVDVVGRLMERFGLRPDAGFDAQLRILPESVGGGWPSLSGLAKSAARSAANVVRAFVCYPDRQRGWYPYALAAALESVRRDHHDVVLTSSPPVTAHLVGRALKARTGIPWVADLRDLWTDDPYYALPRFRKVLDRPLERATLSKADALVTVSEPFRGVLKESYPLLPVWAIPNGYDPEELSPGGQLTSEFSITHTGSLYKGKRNPSLLFEAIAELVAEKQVIPEQVRISFYGDEQPWLRQLARTHGLDAFLNVYPMVSRAEVLDVQRRSQILLVVTSGQPAEIGICPAKVFEYLAARRPILALGGPGSVLADLLRKTRAGVHVATKEELKGVLMRWWTAYTHSGAVPYEASAEDVAKYSQITMAERFSRVLDEVHEGRIT